MSHPERACRTLQVRRSALDRYLIEMIEHNTWATGNTKLLADYRLARHPCAHLPQRRTDMGLNRPYSSRQLHACCGVQGEPVTERDHPS